MDDMNIANGHISGAVDGDGWLGTSTRSENVLDDLVIFALYKNAA